MSEPSNEQLETPGWMKALAALCALTVVVAVARDLFYEPTREIEVWFGFELTGIAAYLTAPIHWAIFAAGAYGFWYRRRWVLPAAAAYELYAAFCHLVWSEVSVNGRGWQIGLLQAIALSAVALALLRAHRNMYAESS